MPRVLLFDRSALVCYDDTATSWRKGADHVHRKVLLICLDGCDPSYIESSETPTLDRIAREGFYRIGRSVIPSVTNVNNTSILTGAFPREHGITSNYCYDRRTQTGQYMESSEFILLPTLLGRAGAQGFSTSLLTAKKKLLHLLGRDVSYGITAEEPPLDLVAALGPPPGIYSAGINIWLLRAARLVLRDLDPDLMYVSTTDYVQHKYAPEAEEARRHLAELDAILGDIIADDPEREVYVTADHGMGAMDRGVDLGKLLASAGFAVVFQPIIKDRYTAHHNNLSGACYLYCQPSENIAAVADALVRIPEVEAAYEAPVAAATFGLREDRVGDLFVLGKPGVVFGEFTAERVPVNVRSHGSRHESIVPIYGYNAQAPAARYTYNLDVVRNLDPMWLAGRAQALS